MNISPLSQQIALNLTARILHTVNLTQKKIIAIAVVAFSFLGLCLLKKGILNVNLLKKIPVEKFKNLNPFKQTQNNNDNKDQITTNEKRIFSLRHHREDFWGIAGNHFISLKRTSLVSDSSQKLLITIFDQKEENTLEIKDLPTWNNHCAIHQYDPSINKICLYIKDNDQERYFSAHIPHFDISFNAFSEEKGILPKNVEQIPRYKNLLPTHYFDKYFVYTVWDKDTKSFLVNITDQKGDSKRQITVHDIPDAKNTELFLYNPQTNTLVIIQLENDEENGQLFFLENTSKNNVSLNQFKNFAIPCEDAVESSNLDEIYWLFDRKTLRFYIIDNDQSTFKTISAPPEIKHDILLDKQLISIQNHLIFLKQDSPSSYELFCFQINQVALNDENKSATKNEWLQIWKKKIDSSSKLGLATSSKSLSKFKLLDLDRYDSEAISLLTGDKIPTKPEVLL